MTEACPGCGVETERLDPRASSYFNASGGCLSLFAEAQGASYSEAATQRLIQVTVDAYAAQHAGGRHPDKSVAVHLTGLYLLFERGLPIGSIAPAQNVLATKTRAWPRLEPPARAGSLTIADVVAAEPGGRAAVIERWAREVWESWSKHRETIAGLAGG